MIFSASLVALVGLFLTSLYLVYRLPHHSTLVDDLKARQLKSYHGQSLENIKRDILLHRRNGVRLKGDISQEVHKGDDDKDGDKQENQQDQDDELSKDEKLYKYVKSIRKPMYPVQQFPESTYDVNNCPDEPPENYPIEWPLMDILTNWNPNNTTFDIPDRPHIYQGLCRFDHKTELHKAQRYREAEVPFVMRDDPKILETVRRWNTPGYLTALLGDDITYKSEYSVSNHLMYFKMRRDGQGHVSTDWKPPMSMVDITYPEWLEKASQPLEDMTPDKPHWYFRVNAKAKGGKGFLFEEMPYFKPEKNFYMVDTSDVRGINCRFGMTGNIAENHFDGSRNFILLFGGERRYILNHPKNCKMLGLYPKSHPSGRHSAIDWTNPDTNMFPQFADARGNEVVMQAGDALYLPTQWFHFIISLETNWQCNARSGITHNYKSWIQKCGF